MVTRLAMLKSVLQFTAIYCIRIITVLRNIVFPMRLLAQYRSLQHISSGLIQAPNCLKEAKMSRDHVCCPIQFPAWVWNLMFSWITEKNGPPHHNQQLLFLSVCDSNVERNMSCCLTNRLKCPSTACPTYPKRLKCSHSRVLLGDNFEKILLRVQIVPN